MTKHRSDNKGREAHFAEQVEAEVRTQDVAYMAKDVPGFPGLIALPSGRVYKQHPKGQLERIDKGDRA